LTLSSCYMDIGSTPSDEDCCSACIPNSP
jgi:hypothetical protein